MQYRIISAKLINKVEEKVNEYIEIGWIPQGSLSCSVDKWAQPMILREKKDETME